MAVIAMMAAAEAAGELSRVHRDGDGEALVEATRKLCQATVLALELRDDMRATDAKLLQAIRAWRASDADA